MARMHNKHVKYQRLIDPCRTLPPPPTAVAHPCDAAAQIHGAAVPVYGGWLAQ